MKKEKTLKEWIALWEGNITFIKERLKLQAEGKVTRDERKYYPHDIEAEERKIEFIKFKHNIN